VAEGRPSPEPRPRRRSGRLRRLVLALMIFLLLGAGGLFFLSRHLTWVARWAMERAFPGAKVELRHLMLRGFNQLDIDRLALRSRKDDSLLLSLSGGSVTFQFSDLAHLQIGEVRLNDPVINASPRLLEAVAPPGGTPRKPGGGGFPWSVRRLVCESGQLNIAGYGGAGLEVAMKFAFDFRDFSPAAGANQHQFALSDIAAATKSGGTFATVKGMKVTFGFDDLGKGTIGEIVVTEPAISLSPSIARSLGIARESGGGTGGGAGGSGAARPWAVRHLTCDYGQLQVAGYGHRGLAVQTKFALDFDDFSPAQGAKEQTLELWGLSATMFLRPAFFTIDEAEVTFTLDGLLKRQRVESFALHGGSVVVGREVRRLTGGAAAANLPPPPKVPMPSESAPAPPYVVGKVDIERLAVTLDDERPDVPDITFALNTTLAEIPLSKAASQVGAQPQVVEFADLEVLSPLDPFAKVLTVGSVKVQFTLAGFLRHELDRVDVRRPTIYVGPDLFWYMDDMKARLGASEEKPGEKGAPEPAWKVNNFTASNGGLVLGSSGRKEYGIPLNFRTEAQNVALDNLAALQFQGELEVPPQEYSFPSYQLAFSSQQSELHLAYPPGEGKNNLVGVIRLSALRWRQYRANDAWLSITFDRQGINAKFGGDVYKGKMWGGFSFFFDTESPWIGWLSGRGVDLQAVTSVISPQNFSLTGPLNFKVQLNAQGKAIERLLGEFHATKPGKMVIGKLNNLLENIPATWSLLKQSSMRIMLETLRDFDYDTARGKFWFVESQGILNLNLKGPNGSRNFEVVLHADDTPEGLWKKREAANGAAPPGQAR